MFRGQLGKMRYQTIGYYTVCLSPLVSILLWAFGDPNFLARPYSVHYLLSIMWHIGVNLLIIGVQVCSIVLYLMGYRKSRMEAKGAPFILLSSILLILWGLFISYLAVALYNNLVQWTLEPYTRELTIWDNIEYATWGLKGLLWIAAGLIFLATEARLY